MEGKKYPRVKLRNEKEIIGMMDPLVKEWFNSRFKGFSDTQKYGVMNIHERKNILISAPTGGTKTLTAFLSILNYLIRLSRKKELEEKVYCVYSSPLKALNNDIYINLKRPLEEIKEIAESEGIEMQEIRVGLRTGDTSSYEKQKMLKGPPHIFVTTPESLAITLTTKKFIELFRGVEFVVVDEIHSLDNKRGVYLSLSLERLEELSVISLVRVGLSATVAPLDEVANFLVGMERDCLIAEVKFLKKTDIKVLTAVEDLIDTTKFDLHSSLYNLIDRLIQNHKTTVIFTNTRAATERVINHLRDMFPENYMENPHKSEISSESKTENFEVIGAHHSALSKEHRFEIEEKLRKGELKVVVTSTSLELGIDIGFIDLVVLLGSPKSSARALQRIGRAGHRLYEKSKGRFVVVDRDDLVESAILGKEAIEKKIDRIHIPKNALDVLSQQIFGMAIQKIWDIHEMFELIKRSYCYSDLSREDFMSVISYLSGEYALENKNVYAKIWYDKESRRVGKRGKLARVLYMTNIGTIPEESFVTVKIGVGERRGQKIGVVDERFLEKMRPGDVFVLGGKKYQFMYTKGMKVYVRAGVKRNPTIPSWFSEMLPLSFDSAMEIQRFRKLMEEKLGGKNKGEILKWIKDYLYCGEHVAKSVYNYFNEQYKFAEIPHERKLLIEGYKGKKNYVIFHSLYGRRVNDALSRAIGYLMGQKTRRDIEIGISDNGFYFCGEKLPVEEVLKVLKSKNLREILEEAISKTEVLKRRFRHCAGRSLMILRSYKGRKKSVGKQQMKSFFLLHAVNKLSKNFPILKEARREVLEDLMDIYSAEKVLGWVEKKKVKIKKINTGLPSPFAMNLVMQGQSDLMRIEDKIEFLKRMHKAVKGEIGDGKK